RQPGCPVPRAGRSPRGPGAGLQRDGLLGGGARGRPPGDPVLAGVLRAARPRPLPAGQRLAAVLLPQAGGPALLPDLARQPAQADRARPAAPGLLPPAPPPSAADRARRLGLPAEPERVLHPVAVQRVPLRRSG